MASPRWSAAGGLFVAALAVAAYLPGLPGAFVYDDHRLIVENDGLKRPFELRRSFLRDYYASDIDRMGLGYYRPVTLLTTELDYRRGGGRAPAFHATNIAIHVACALMVLTLGVLLVGQGVPALAAAALFALHPAHAESVAFISGRVDPLATLFGLVALACHLRGNRADKEWPWRLAAGASWLAALMSKEIAVTIPVIAALLDVAEDGWPRGRGWIDRARRFVPYAAAVAVYLPLRLVALGALLPVSAPAAISWTRPPVVLGSYVLWLMVPPPGIHLEPALPPGGWALAAAVVALAAVSAIALLARAGWRLEAALASWCVVALLPVAQLRPLETELSERFLYLSSAGAMLLAGALLARLAGRYGVLAAVAIAVVVGGLYAGILIPRSRLWRDEIALWTARQAESGASLKASLNLARAYAARGDREHALAAYDAAAKLDPALAAGMQAEIGALRGSAGSDAYEASLRESIAALPEDGALWNNLGFHLYSKGDFAGAAGAFDRAVALTPARGSGWLGLALCRLAAKDWAGADDAASRASTLDPALGLARAIRVECALATGRACDALGLAEGVVLDDPAERERLERMVARAREACPR